MKNIEPYSEDEVSSISDYANELIFDAIQNTKKNCYMRTFKIFYLIFMLMLCPISSVLLVYGKNIVQPVNCTSDFTIHSCLYSTLDVGFSIFYILLYYQAHIFNEFGCCRIPKYHIFKCNELSHMKHKTYVTIFVMYLLSNNFIILAHVIGWFILKYFDIDEFFTYKTSLMGSFAYLTFMLLFIFLYWLFRIMSSVSSCIKKCNRSQEEAQLKRASKGRLDLNELIDNF